MQGGVFMSLKEEQGWGGLQMHWIVFGMIRNSSVKREAVWSCWQFVGSVNQTWVYDFSSGIHKTVLHEKPEFGVSHCI